MLVIVGQNYEGFNWWPFIEKDIVIPAIRSVYLVKVVNVQSWTYLCCFFRALIIIFFLIKKTPFEVTYSVQNAKYR